MSTYFSIAAKGFFSFLFILILAGTAFPLPAASGEAEEKVLIFAGDTLEIEVSGQSQMGEKYEVGPDGDIYPLMSGKIHAAGMDLAGLREELKKRLQKSPEKSIEVSVRFLSRNRFVNIQGGVRYPGWYRVPHATNLDQMAVIAGGILLGVDISLSKLTRITDGNIREINTQGGIEPMSGDTLIIPESRTSVNRIDCGDALFIKLPGSQQGAPSAALANSIKDLAHNEILVDRSGFIALPGLAHLYVQGLTTDEVGLMIEKRLPPYQTRSSSVDVSILEKRHYVRVMGHIERPGWYNVPKTATVQEALALAGGVLDGAVMSDVAIERISGTGLLRMNADLYQYGINGDIRILVTLHANDTIFVPIPANLGNIRRKLQPWMPPDERKDKIYVIGQVKKPGVYELTDNMGVLQAVALAGGLDEWADGSDIRIIRKTNAKEEPVIFNYKKAVSKKADPFAIILKPDDTIFVP